MHRRPGIGFLVLAACQAPAAAPDAQPSAPAAIAPPPPTPPAAPTPVAAPVAEPPAPTAPPAEPITYAPGPLAATAVDRGVLVVWSRHDVAADKSEILGLLLDDTGTAKGEPRLIRRTSGRLLDLAVDRQDGAAWLAWFALLAEQPRPRGLVAAILVEPDLSSMRAPITLGQFSDPSITTWSDRPMLRLLDLEHDQAAVVAAGVSMKCDDFVTGRKSPCPGFDLYWLDPNGTSTTTGRVGVDGGDPALGSFVATDTGVLLDLWAWHGGATHATLFARPGQPPSKAPFPTITCRPPFTRVWTGTDLVALCRGDYAAEGEACSFNDKPDEEGECSRLRVGSAPAVAWTRETHRCHDGRPVVDLAWKGGKLRLADGRGMWTGSHAIEVGVDGRVERWTCSGDTLAAIDPPTDVLPLDPDKPPQPVPVVPP